MFQSNEHHIFLTELLSQGALHCCQGACLVSVHVMYHQLLNLKYIWYTFMLFFWNAYSEKCSNNTSRKFLAKRDLYSETTEHILKLPVLSIQHYRLVPTIGRGEVLGFCIILRWGDIKCNIIHLISLIPFSWSVKS